MPKINVEGIGVNDATYNVTRSEIIEGKRKITWSCPFYLVWKEMIRRCLSNKFKERHQTYKDASVCKEWLLFSNFKTWMEQQDWDGKDLDKDIILFGNKHYSPETCAFVNGKVNRFVVYSESRAGNFPQGVYLNKKLGKFQASCKDAESGKNRHLGLFETPEDAHQARRKRKHEIACELSKQESDERVRAALANRYA